jgi:hypothetical protein
MPRANHSTHARSEQFWSLVDKRGPTECWEWTGPRLKGYGRFVFEGKWRAHRVAWEMAAGRPPPAGLEVCHSCDNPPCCNPAHLWVGTHAENMADMAAKGRSRGTLSPGVRLDEMDLEMIRVLRRRLPRRAIANRFGVSEPTIQKIVARRWSVKRPHPGPGPTTVQLPLSLR